MSESNIPVPGQFSDAEDEKEVEISNGIQVLDLKDDEEYSDDSDDNLSDDCYGWEDGNSIFYSLTLFLVHLNF